MRVVYAPSEQKHRPGHVVKKGKPSATYDIRERATRLLAAIRRQGHGPILAPSQDDTWPIRAIHDANMLDYLETAYDSENASSDPAEALFPTFFPPPGQRRRPTRVYGRRGLYCTDMGTPLGPHTWEAARASASCASAAARYIVGGEHTVYALCRPPGHHAGPDFFGGYCYLNNAAVATHVLRQAGGTVAVLDIDYHHGNGSQAFSEGDPEVWYGSLHIDPATDYPFFAGYADERGVGDGEGTVCNMPLPPNTPETAYLQTLERLAAMAMAFEPHWLVVSVGFDTYAHDPIGTFGVTTDGYARIGELIASLGLRTLLVQEGGYYLADLGRNLSALLAGLGS